MERAWSCQTLSWARLGAGVIWWDILAISTRDIGCSCLRGERMRDVLYFWHGYLIARTCECWTLSPLCEQFCTLVADKLLTGFAFWSCLTWGTEGTLFNPVDPAAIWRSLSLFLYLACCWYKYLETSWKHLLQPSAQAHKYILCVVLGIQDLGHGNIWVCRQSNNYIEHLRILVYIVSFMWLLIISNGMECWYFINRNTTWTWPCWLVVIPFMCCKPSIG